MVQTCDKIQIYIVLAHVILISLQLYILYSTVDRQKLLSFRVAFKDGTKLIRILIYTEIYTYHINIKLYLKCAKK